MREQALEKSYYRDVQKTSLLSLEEERELARRVREGDEAARQKLVQSNVRLVIKIARQYHSPCLNFADLLQEGNIGLLYAVDRYDLKHATRFASYAVWWIRHFIGKAIDRDSRPIRLPYRVSRSLRKRNRVQEECLDFSDQESSTDPPIVDDVVFESSEIDKHGDTTYAPESYYERQEKRALQRELVSTLGERERQVISARFPLDGGKPKTLAAIGDELNVSSEAVRCTTIRAIKKLSSLVENKKKYGR